MRNIRTCAASGPVPRFLEGQASRHSTPASRQGGGSRHPTLYQAIFEANLADQGRRRIWGTTSGWQCRAWGLPAMMNVYQPMEIVVLPDVTDTRPTDATEQITAPKVTYCSRQMQRKLLNCWALHIICNRFVKQ